MRTDAKPLTAAKVRAVLMEEGYAPYGGTSGFLVREEEDGVVSVVYWPQAASRWSHLGDFAWSLEEAGIDAQLDIRGQRVVCRGYLPTALSEKGA